MSAPDVLTLTDEQSGGGRTRAGRVIAGSGMQYLVMIEHRDGGAAALSAGDVLVVGEAPNLCVATVTAMTVPAPAGPSDGDEIWVAELCLHGTLSRTGFDRGVTRAPALGDPACLASQDDLERLYAGQDGALAPLGTLAVAPDVAASAPLGDLAAGFGLFGTSGSGKSSSLAVIIRSLLRSGGAVRPVILDVHDEYGRSFGKAARLVRPGAGFVPHWLLTFPELCWALSLLGGDLSAEERSLLEEAIPAARRRMLQRSGANTAVPITLEGPVPYRLTDVVSWLDRNIHVDERRSGASYQRLRGRLAAAPVDARLRVVFGAVAANDTLPLLLGQVFGFGGEPSRLSVVQLGHLALGLDRLVVTVLCRLATALGEGTQGQSRVLMVLEDAQRYAPRGETIPICALSRAALLGLAGKGARAGVSLALTTSKPTQLSTRLARDVPTFFVHRTPSGADRDAIAAILPEGSPASVASAGTLGDRDCIAVGRAVPVPGRYVMTALPAAAVPGASRKTQAAPVSEDMLAALIDHWRFGDDKGGEPETSLRDVPRSQVQPASPSAPPRIVPAA